MSKKIFKRNLYKSDQGVVGIVVAVLLIGLMVSFLSIIQVFYVPSWMKEKEAEHMDDVLNQFSQLKLVIDTQSVIKQENTPMTTSITLGSSELPFFMSMKAFGNLEIVKNACNIEITTVSNDVSTFNLGIIKYTSANAYYIPEEKQSFIYEAGAIITSQTKNNSISITPSFKPITNPSYKIIFKIVNISGVGGKISYGGYDTIPIQTEYTHGNSFFNRTIEDVEFINITTSYSNAWYVFLNSSLDTVGYIYDTDYDINILNNKIIIQFLNTPHRPDLELTFINILGQIGPGWIE